MGINYLQVGDRIRSLREIRGMTASDLANRTGFTAKSMLLAENGRAAISLEFLLDICSALDVTPNDILRGMFRETDVYDLEREGLLNDALAQNAKSSEKTKSYTKISDPETTAKAIEEMLDNARRERRETQGDTQKWRSSYYK